MTSNSSNKSHKHIMSWSKIIILGLTAIIIELFFFRNVIFNSNLLGDFGDGRLLTLMLEHYYNFVNGKESFNNLNIFYPASNTLGYSDMLLGLAIPYIPLRFLGLDMLLATKCSCILIHFLGTISIIYFLYKELNLKLLPTIIGAICFSYANSYSVSTSHIQLFTISLVPLLLIFISKFFNNLNNIKKRDFYAILSVIVYCLLFYTGYYIGYFFTLGVIILILLMLIYYIISKKIKNILLLIINDIKSYWTSYIFYILLAIILMIPFLSIYIPVYSSTGGFSNISSLDWYSIINVNTTNIVYGKLMQNLNFINDETPSGFPIIHLIIFIFSSIYIFKNISIKKNSTSNLIIKLLPIATMFFYLLPINILGTCLWNIIRLILPGATAIRVLCRMIFFLILPISIIIAIACNTLLEKSKNAKKISCILILLIFVLIIENTQIDGVYSKWSSEDYYKIESTISKPPDSCKIFFIIDSGETPKYDKSYSYPLEAFMIATKYNLRTLNGYSGQAPQNWDLFNVRTPYYMNNLKYWMAVNNLYDEEIYVYDLGTCKWSIFEMENK